MQLCATLTRADLTSLIEEITPLRLQIRPRKVITIGRPSTVELVAGAGLRVRGSAHFTWDAYGGLTIPVTLRSWQVLLVPSFVPRGASGHVLAFTPVLEALDFRRLPMFLADRVADAVKGAVRAQRHKLVWDFEKHLSVIRAMPVHVSPRDEIALAPTGGTITVTEDEMRLTLMFGVRLARSSVSSPYSAAATAVS